MPLLIALPEALLNQNPTRFAPPKILHFLGFEKPGVCDFVFRLFAKYEISFLYQVAMRALYIFLDIPMSSLN